MKLEDLEIYQIAMSVGEKVWVIVDDWNYFAKDTVGKQLVKASDSIAANISEGFGRYYYKEARQFTYFARGSLFETKTWLQKGHQRNLIPAEDYSELINLTDVLGIKLNNYINSLNKLLKKANSLVKNTMNYDEVK
jgi:four helix bundle protein